MGRRIMGRLIEVVEGVLGGLAVVAILAVFLAVVPMLRKRAELSSSEGQSVPATNADSRQCRTPEISLPPATYGMACDEDDLAIREALLSEISSMRSVPAFWPPDWLTLPDVVLPKDGELARRRVIDLVNGIYSDSPELSVYTDGQCCAVAGFLSQWRLGGEGVYVSGLPFGLSQWGIKVSADSTQEEDKREFSAVTAKLDAIACELAVAAETQEYAEARETLGPDGLYAALAYRWIGAHSRYSDGVNDTRHANDIYGVLFEGESQCYGSACALKALLERGGIPAFVATGDHADSPDTAGHAWVVARMGGQWFAFDGSGAQVLQEEDSVDLQLIALRRGKWQSFAVPVDEYLQTSDLRLDQMCERLMDRYRELVSPIEQEAGVPHYEWMELASEEERDEAYRTLRMTKLAPNLGLGNLSGCDI